MALEPLTVLLSATLFAISAIFLYTFSAGRRRFTAMVNKLPGPPTLPLIGNMLDIMVPRNQIMEVLTRVAMEHGPIFRIWNGPITVITITKPEYIETIISGTANTEKSWLYTFLHPWLGQGLLTSSGSKWHSHRKMITPTFHFSILEPFCEVFAEKSQILVQKLRKEMELRGDEGFDIYPFITRCALDIICETAMGTEIRAQEDTESEYVKAIHNISELTMYRSFRVWLHPNFIFWKSAAGRRYNQCLKVLHGFTNRVIQERKAETVTVSKGMLTEKKENEEAVLGKKKRMAFLDLLLKASQDSGSNQLTDTEIREEVDTFMFEGHDTTTAGISWALFLLGSNPDVQEQAFEELDSIFQGSDRPITMRDLHEMKYLERVIKESLRLYPSVPLIMRQLSEDVVCGPYTLPKGVTANINIFVTHRNPDTFPNPEEFNPDHFLPDRVQGRHPYAYIPFSAGPRNCIGQKFALLEEKTILASVLREFRLRSIEKREDMKLLGELILKSESGIKMVLTPRSKRE